MSQRTIRDILEELAYSIKITNLDLDKEVNIAVGKINSIIKEEIKKVHQDYVDRGLGEK